MFASVQFSRSAVSDSLECSTPGFPVLHQLLSHVALSLGLLKLRCVESVMPSNHLILGRPLLFLPSIFLSIRVFSNESALRIRWPKYWRFSISPSSKYSALISFTMDGLELPALGLRCSMWDLLPWPGIEPWAPLHWEGGVLTTGSPGKSQGCHLFHEDLRTRVNHPDQKGYDGRMDLVCLDGTGLSPVPRLDQRLQSPTFSLPFTLCSETTPPRPPLTFVNSPSQP